MPEKLESCVRQVMDQGWPEKNAWAICRASTGLTKDGDETKIIENALKIGELMKQSDKNFTLPDTYDLQGIEIFASGEWNGDKYTNNDLDAIIHSFYETKDELKPYLKLGHDKNQKLVQKDGFPALGWIESLRRVGNKLVADFKRVPKRIYELMQAGAYRRVSSELYTGMKVKEKVYPYLLKAVAILGGDTPAVESLSDLVALYASECNVATYEETQAFKSYEYKSMEDESMTQQEIEKIQKDLAEAQKNFSEAEAKVKEIEAKAKELEKENGELKKTNEGLSGRVENLEKSVANFSDEKRASEINAVLDKAVTDKKILPSQKPHLFSLMSASNGEKKFKMGDKEHTAKEVLESFIALNSVEIQTDEKSQIDSTSKDFAERVKQHSEKHKVSIAEATVAVGSAEGKARTL